MINKNLSFLERTKLYFWHSYHFLLMNPNVLCYMLFILGSYFLNLNNSKNNNGNKQDNEHADNQDHQDKMANDNREVNGDPLENLDSQNSKAQLVLEDFDITGNGNWVVGPSISENFFEKTLIILLVLYILTMIVCVLDKKTFYILLNFFKAFLKKMINRFVIYLKYLFESFREISLLIYKIERKKYIFSIPGNLKEWFSDFKNDFVILIIYLIDFFILRKIKNIINVIKNIKKSIINLMDLRKKKIKNTKNDIYGLYSLIYTMDLKKYISSIPGNLKEWFSDFKNDFVILVLYLMNLIKEKIKNTKNEIYWWFSLIYNMDLKKSIYSIPGNLKEWFHFFKKDFIILVKFLWKTYLDFLKKDMYQEFKSKLETERREFVKRRYEFRKKLRLQNKKYIYQEFMGEEFDYRTMKEKRGDYLEIFDLMLLWWDKFYLTILKPVFLFLKDLTWIQIIQLLFITLFYLTGFFFLLYIKHYFQIDGAINFIFCENYNPDLSNREVYIKTFGKMLHESRIQTILTYCEHRLSKVFPTIFSDTYRINGILFKYEESDAAWRAFNVEQNEILKYQFDMFNKYKEKPTFYDYFICYTNFFLKCGDFYTINASTVFDRNSIIEKDLIDRYTTISRDKYNDELFDKALLEFAESRKTLKASIQLKIDLLPPFIRNYISPNWDIPDFLTFTPEFLDIIEPKQKMLK